MLGPKITDPQILKEIEILNQEAAERGGFHDPVLEAWLEEEEQEPGYWEGRAALCEKLWPSKKPEAEGTPPAAPES